MKKIISTVTILYISFTSYAQPSITLFQAKAINNFKSSSVNLSTSASPQAISIVKIDSLIREIKLRLKNTSIANLSLQKSYRDSIDSIRRVQVVGLKSPYRGTSFSILNISTFQVDSLNNYLYDQTRLGVLTNISFLSYGLGDQYLNGELASYMFGPLRVGLGTSIKTQTTDVKADSLKLKNSIQANLKHTLNQGGAITLNSQLPLYYTRSADDYVHFGLFGNFNLGFLSATYDTTKANIFKTTDFRFINQNGLTIHFDACDNKRVAQLTADLFCYYAWGSKKMYSELGITDYSAIKLQAGFRVSETFSVLFTGILASTNKIVKDAAPITMTVNLSPGKLF